jgi:hypothetical protein
MIQIISIKAALSYIYSPYLLNKASLILNSSIMKKIIIGLLALGLTTQAFTQITKVEKLSEVVLRPANYKYLNATDNRTAAIPVKMLERKVAAYDVTEQEYYEDDYDFYTVSFFIPDGKIVAVYDDKGELMRTIEKFKDIKLPNSIQSALLDRFPNWTVVNDVYRVTYSEKGVNKTYKLKLKNGEKTMRVKMAENGEFL